MTDFSNIKGVFFDWDGTLADSFDLLLRSHNHIRAQFGLEPFSREGFAEYFGQPREKLYTHLYGDRKEEAKKMFVEYVLNNHLEGVKAIGGAEDVLQWFKERGIICGVVTNKAPPIVKKEISSFGWDHYFQVVVGAAEAEEDKPSPAPLLLALQRTGLEDVPREQILFVGDTDNDVRCSNGAGTVTVFIENIEKYEELLQSNNVAFHFESVQCFYDFLLQSESNSVIAKTVG